MLTLQIFVTMCYATIAHATSANQLLVLLSIQCLTLACIIARTVPTFHLIIPVLVGWLFFYTWNGVVTTHHTPPIKIAVKQIQLLPAPPPPPKPEPELVEPTEEPTSLPEPAPLPPTPDPTIEAGLSAFKSSMEEHLLVSLATGRVKLRIYFGQPITINVLERQGSLTATVVRAAYNAAQAHLVFWQGRSLEICVTKAPLAPEDPLDKITGFQIDVQVVDPTQHPAP